MIVKRMMGAETKTALSGGVKMSFTYVLAGSSEIGSTPIKGESQLHRKQGLRKLTGVRK